MSPSNLLDFRGRKLDLLWTAVSLALAVATWLYALRDGYAPIELFVALHVQSALVFAVRQPARFSTKRPLEIFVTVASLIYILAYERVPLSDAPLAPLGGMIAAAGALLTLVSVHCLGRSFAILPALREIRTSGVYRFVRHPIYLSYLITAVGILLRHPTLYNVAVALVGIALILCRIRFEERLLAQDAAYRAYMGAVRFRLIPGVY